MPSFTLTEAKAHHCGQMLRHLRKDNRNAMLMLGYDLHRHLRTCFDASSTRKAWWIDGRLAGLGGVMGTQASAAGYIWLAFSEEATRFPLALVKEAKAQLDEVMMTKRMLIATTLVEDGTSARFAAFMGFDEQDNGNAEHRVWVKRSPVPSSLGQNYWRFAAQSARLESDGRVV